MKLPTNISPIQLVIILTLPCSKLLHSNKFEYHIIFKFLIALKCASDMTLKLYPENICFEGVN